MYVFDIEADGLDATKIHCLSVWTGNVLKSTSDYDDMRKFFAKADILIGHNICRYDIPTVERILGIKVKAKLVDTLALSWYIYPDQVIHGLEEWGERFGVPKVKIDDWQGLSVKEYIERCEQDVRINLKLWDQQYEALLRLYESEEELWRLIDYLSFKMDCAALQEASRWKLDVERCKSGRDTLLKEKEEKIEQLKRLMPPVPKYTVRARPKKCYKQSGELSSLGEKWFKLLEEQRLHPETQEVTVLVGHDAPNPGSHTQVKEYLFGLGWKPDEFKYVKEDAGTTRKIPQINTQKPGEVGVTDSVRRLIEEVPELEALDGLYVISHRIGILEGFLDNADEEGYIQAQIQGFTNTLRFKHKVAVNLPKPNVPYGELVRGCLIAPKGYELCGSDMSGLEDRTKQHYLWPHDPDYVKTMMAPDYDPHTTLAVSAGAMTAQQEAQYKTPDCPHELKKSLKKVRDTYKTTNYSATYGAGGPKIALAAGVPTAKGYELHKAYWELNWAIIAVANETKTKKCNGGMWLYNPVSKLWYSLRHDKDKFSTLNQGTGVWCFDTWMKNILKRRRQLTAQFHDEGVWTVGLGHREEFEKILTDAINDTNDELKLNRELGIDIAWGDNYAAVH